MLAEERVAAKYNPNLPVGGDSLDIEEAALLTEGDAFGLL